MPRLTLLFLVALLASAARRGAVDASIVDGLEVGFYGQSCPDAEGAIRNVVNNEISMNRGIAPGLIRLFFHDCFITGCDASILLDESPAGDVPEKESSANGFTLVGLRTIDIAKSTVEAMCPRTVSCADILAFAARDAAVAAGLPSYDVAAGRRDGMRSNMDDLPGNFPVPGHHVPRLTELFSQRGLTQEDLVALSGAHSIGGAHCFMFSNRIYGFSKDADVDPSLDLDYAARLRQVCPPKNPNNDPQQAPKVKFDARTGERLDAAYYSELLARRGLLTSDNALIEDTQTRAMVEAFARDEVMWQQKFAEAMQKVGMLDVLIGEDKGQVRRQCRLVNGQEQQQLPWFRPHFPWFRQRRPPRPFPHNPMGDLINGFFRGFH
ncbi:peroxidase 5 [Panicum miliaceum]|uniref:Peroxidase n=1 Tax=Panicum miliaceum TaxID=4540 RepID=A0A3L6PJE0_PANMI|nr:peroxidase 5 [Panicum miliaceum]